MIYLCGRRITESKNFLGQHISQTAAEYISLIIGLRMVRRSIRTLRNKEVTIQIKSQIAVNQIRNI